MGGGGAWTITGAACAVPERTADLKNNHMSRNGTAIAKTQPSPSITFIGVKSIVGMLRSIHAKEYPGSSPAPGAIPRHVVDRAA